MRANDTNKEIVHKELSYKINGLLFETHNKLGRFCREKQYADTFEELLIKNKVNYKREAEVDMNDKPDFIVEDKIVIELKTKPVATKDHYYQVQRYLENSNLKLGLLVNFRSRYLKPIRVIRANS